MTPEQKAAFVNAQAICAMIERAAMTWDNNAEIDAKRPVKWRHADFMNLQHKYLIGHNAVLDFFRS